MQIGIHVIPSREGLFDWLLTSQFTLIIHSVAGWVITTLEVRYSFRNHLISLQVSLAGLLIRVGLLGSFSQFPGFRLNPG